ncbi:MAG: hypothetical protein ACR2KS_10115 [Candidatus Eremiobacter antarcticus]|nr:hypothetical protein [Candidatus Eremiobacteraeota bacterium]MBC5808788.1 hypothetical protein [Candidatus Eremiobacteraeota bacterium]
MANDNGAATSSLSMFAPEKRGELLKLVVGKKTGVEVSVGGLTIDLLPLSTAEGLSLFSYVREYSFVFKKLQNNEFSQMDFADIIGKDGPEISRLLGLFLARCVGLALEPRPDVRAQDPTFLELRDFQLADQPERDSFVLWYASLDLSSTLREVGPKLLKANGLSAMVDPQPAASPDVAENKATPSSTQSTPSATS